MEDDLNFLEIEDDLNIFENGKRPLFLINQRRSYFFLSNHNYRDKHCTQYRIHAAISNTVHTGQKACPSGIKKLNFKKNIKKTCFALVFQLGMSFETKD